MKKILVVDDEKRLVTLVSEYLIQSGFRVVSAYDGREALELARQEKPDLIILDLMMPEMDGYEFMQEHRKEFDTPIILLTARVEDDEKVIGLEMGADDYITKPFRPRELVARVRSVLRRAGGFEHTQSTITAADVVLDQNSRMVSIAGEEINLTPSEFDLLAALMSNPGKVYTRLDLLDILQGVRYEGYERTVDSHVKNLRAKMEAASSRKDYIETIYGIGYRFRRE
ncbi:MAG: response regulator transcription factor [Anaerolineales bacterium]